MAERFGPALEGEPASVAETHVSVVVFVGDRAYKLKKPVSMGFLDFSTREAREAACRREIELNRRLAPDVYVGVADVLGPDGRPCDHLVVMRRMPSDRRLSTLVRSGVEVDDDVRRVARAVARFHASARTGPEVEAEAGRDAIRDKWSRNVEQVGPFVGPVLDPADAARVSELVQRYLDGRGRLFEDRIARGRARDGHGDLLADDIFCLADGPRILDCIEFDDRLRYGDVLGDVAFLAMDLERIGAPVLGARFLAWYREFAAETSPASLVHHYVAYRAHIRTKVACLRHEQGDPQSAVEARDLLAIAVGHLERARVRLVLVGGLPGTGKSTLAGALADAAGWTVLRSDEVRKDLAGVGHDERRAHAYGSGLYAPERTAVTYHELLARARIALEEGESVVLDASWAEPAHRKQAADMGAGASADIVALRCKTPEELAAARLRRRVGDVSDASPEVAARMAASFGPWPDAVAIDTAGPAEHALAAALKAAGEE